MTLRTVSTLGFEFLVDDEGVERFWSHIDGNRWELSVLQAVASLAHRAGMYVDVGAWIGPTVLVAAATGARVSAYEPDPVAAAKLRRNLELNPGLAERVNVRELALTSHGRETVLSSGKLGDSMASALRRQPDSTVVPSARIDHELAAVGADESTVIKMDVEGAEFELLWALKRFLRRRRATLIVSFHNYYLLERLGRLQARIAGALAKRKVIPLLLLYRHWYWSVPPQTWQELTLQKKLGFFFTLSLREPTIVFSRRPLDLP